MEHSDALPVKGFVYKRKEFFASLENLTDVGLVSSSPTGTSICSVPSFNTTSCNGTRPRFRRVNSSEQFQERVETYERLKERIVVAGEPSIKSTRKSHGKGALAQIEKKTNEESNLSTLTKWQSLSALDEEIKSYEKSLSSQNGASNEEALSTGKPLKNGNVGDNGTSALPKKIRNGNEEKKVSKPHWTTLFSQRLSQIRQKFEKQSKLEIPRDENGTLQKSSLRDSNNSLNSFPETYIPSEGCVERRDSISEYLPPPPPAPPPPPVFTSLNGSGQTGSTKNGSAVEVITSKRVLTLESRPPSRLEEPRVNGKHRFLEVYQTLEKKAFPKPPGQTFKTTTTTQVTITQKRPENTKIKQIYQTLEQKNRQNDFYRSRTSIDCDEYMCRKQNDLFDKWGPFGPIAPDKKPPWKMALKPTLCGKALLQPEEKSKANTNLCVSDGIKGKEAEGDSVSVKSAVTPACLPSEGFTADDKVKHRTTLKDWDPVSHSDDSI